LPFILLLQVDFSSEEGIIQDNTSAEWSSFLVLMPAKSLDPSSHQGAKKLGFLIVQGQQLRDFFR
jgi:hypothetical protein